MTRMLDVTGDRVEWVNLAHVRTLSIKVYGGKRIGLEFVYSNGETDTYMVTPGRWDVLEDTLLELGVVV